MPTPHLPVDQQEVSNQAQHRGHGGGDGDVTLKIVLPGKRGEIHGQRAHSRAEGCDFPSWSLSLKEAEAQCAFTPWAHPSFGKPGWSTGQYPACWSHGQWRRRTQKAINHSKTQDFHAQTAFSTLFMHHAVKTPSAPSSLKPFSPQGVPASRWDDACREDNLHLRPQIKYSLGPQQPRLGGIRHLSSPRHRFSCSFALQSLNQFASTLICSSPSRALLKATRNVIIAPGGAAYAET